MRDRAHRPLTPQGVMSADRMPEFAAFFRATLSPEAAREAIDRMYSVFGNYSGAMRRHIEMQRTAAIGG